jgi:amidase
MTILYRSAFDLADDIKAGTYTSREVLELFIARIEKHNPAINAVVAFNFDDARIRADEADKAIADGEDWGALHGVPLTIKDAIMTKGLVTVGGMV